MGFEMKKSTQR